MNTGTSTASSSPVAKPGGSADGSGRRLAGLLLTHRYALGLALVVLGLRVVRPTTPAGPLRLAGWELPPTCPVRLFTGHPCPSCGTARALVYLLRGDVRKSLAANPMGILLLPAVLLAAAAHGVCPGRDVCVQQSTADVTH